MSSFDVATGTARTIASGSAERGAPVNVAGQLDLGGRLETSPPAGRGVGTATGVARAGGIAPGIGSAGGAADASPVIRRPIDLRVASGDSETIASGTAPRFQPVDVAGEVNVAGELNVLDEPSGTGFGAADASPELTPDAPGIGTAGGASLPAGLATGLDGITKSRSIVRVVLLDSLLKRRIVLRRSIEALHPGSPLYQTGL